MKPEISILTQTFIKVRKPNPFVTSTDVKFKLLPNIYMNFWRITNKKVTGGNLKKIIIGAQWLFWEIFVEVYYGRHT